MIQPMAIDYYTTGGGEQLVRAFNAVAAVVGSDLMDSVARLAIVVGLIMVLYRILFRGEFVAAAKWAGLALVVWLGLVQTTATVHVNDSANPFLPNRVIDNVPWGVAFFGGKTSEASRIISDRLTAITATPDAISYQRNGFLFGANLLSQTTRLRVIDDHLAATLSNFLEQCILYGSLLNHTNFEVVANSDNLASVIPAELSNSLAFLSQEEVAGSVVSETRECGAGYADVLSRLDDEVERVLLREAYGRYPSEAFSNAERISRYSDDLEAFQFAMIGSSITARDRIRQSMFITALDGSVERFLGSSGNSAAMQSYIAAKAEAQSFASKNTAGLIAAKFVPLAKIVFEVLYVVFFPVAVFLMMTPYAETVIRGYFGGFLWLASWEIVSVPLHNLAISSFSDSYSSAAAFINEAGVRENIISYANHLGVRSVEQDIASTAGYFLVFAPVIASGLVFGASRLASVATSSISATQGAVNETAREGVAGSPSLNTPSLDMMRANELKTSSNVDTGRASGFLANGASFTTNADGSFALASGSALTTGGVDFRMSEDYGQRLATRLENSQARSAEQLNSFAEGVTSYARQTSDFMNSISTGTQLSDGVQLGDGSRYSDSVRDAVNRVYQWSNDNGVSAQTTVAAGLLGRLGAQVPKGGVIDAGVGSNLSSDAKALSSESFSDVQRAAEEAGLSKDFAIIRDAMESQSASQSQNSGVSSTTGDQVSLDRMSSALSQFQQSYREVESLSRSVEAYQTQNISGSVLGTQAFMQSLNDQLSHLPVGERIERIADLVMAKDFLGDDEGRMLAHTFIADSARSEGLAALPTGSGVVSPSEAIPNLGAGFRQSLPQSDDDVASRFYDNAAGLEAAANGALPSVADISAGYERRRDSMENRQDNINNTSGFNEAITMAEVGMIKDQVSEHSRDGAVEHGVDKVMEKFE